MSDSGFSERGLMRFRNFLEKEAIECDFQPVQTLVTLNSQDDLKQAKSQLKPGERLLSKDELADGIGTNYYSGAIEKPGYSTIQPAKLMFGLARACVDAGVTIYEESPALSIVHGQRPRVNTPDGEIESDQIVVATNAYTPRLGVMRNLVFPIHHFTVATRKLTGSELANLGLDRWRLRFDHKLISCTFGLTPDAHFFMRLPLNYAASNTEVWSDIPQAKALAEHVCKQRYPVLSEVPYTFGWHGVTGHTIALKPVVQTIGSGNVHVSVALNGLGIMPGHNFGYLTACRIAGGSDPDIDVLSNSTTSIPFPTEFYRSLILRPALSALNGYY